MPPLSLSPPPSPQQPPSWMDIQSMPNISYSLCLCENCGKGENNWWWCMFSYMYIIYLHLCRWNSILHNGKIRARWWTFAHWNNNEKNKKKQTGDFVRFNAICEFMNTYYFCFANWILFIVFNLSIIFIQMIHIFFG